jgi:hypothetical protein
MVFFLLSMPVGNEWITILILLAFIVSFPVMAIVFYFNAKELRIENKALMARLSDRIK